MQNVSREYKESMRGIGRNRGYIKATIGIVNSKAQDTAEVKPESNNLLYFSNVRAPFHGGVADKIYAMPEEDFSRVDGTMYFAPEEDIGYTYYNNGIVSNGILGSIYISFGDTQYDIKGLSIDFGDCYPTHFIVENDIRTLTYENNDKRYWNTEDAYASTSFLRITPLQMVNGEGRLRILKFSCGITNTFVNDDVINYSEKEYVSPIAESLPSNDVTLTVKNYDLYYLPDNPESALAFMEQGQEVKVALGYDVDGKGNIEWLPDRITYLKTWKANESQAVFTATDIFDNMSGTYYRGKYRPEGISLYDLAEDVFLDANIENYFIDTYLQDIIVYNPVPVVSHSVALQIIANAGRCAISQDRYGRIHIQSSFVPEMTITANNQTEYSHVDNLLTGDIKAGYATASNDFSILDGSLRFLPENGMYLETGYISESLWVESNEPEVKKRLSFRLGNDLKAFKIGGYWKGEMPVLTLTLEASYTAFGFGINFRNVAPKKFEIITYHADQVKEHITISDPAINFYTNEAFVDFDKMEIVFSMGYPNSRIFVDNIIVGQNTDYLLDRNQMKSAPVATRQNKIRQIAITYNNYKESTESSVVASEEILVPSDLYEYTSYFRNAAYGLILCFNCEDENVTAEIIESSNFYAKIRFSGVTSEIPVNYSISGYNYVVEEQKLIVPYNDDGEMKTWNNPLVSTVEHALELEKWIANYLLGDVEYDIDWRGDPAVDANDLFQLETKVGMKYIRNYENTLSFNGAFSGRMKARKVVR